MGEMTAPQDRSEESAPIAAVEVRHCPRCGETHLLIPTPLTYEGVMSVRLFAHGPLELVRWTHYMMCPTWNEPIMHGWESVYDDSQVTIALVTPDRFSR